MVNYKEQEVSLPVGGMSFLVRIQYCQNTTWQGTVQWLEEKKTRPFRSLLELIQLINDAVNDCTQTKPESPRWALKEDAS